MVIKSHGARFARDVRQRVRRWPAGTRPGKEIEQLWVPRRQIIDGARVGPGQDGYCDAVVAAHSVSVSDYEIDGATER
jgi:hypothetical protein